MPVRAAEQTFASIGFLWRGIPKTAIQFQLDLRIGWFYWEKLKVDGRQGLKNPKKGRGYALLDSMGKRELCPFSATFCPD
jgi:hypothetical protein